VSNLADRISTLLLSRRIVVAGVVVALGVLAGLSALHLKSDFTLEELFTEDGKLRRAADDFRKHFGNTDNLLIVMVEAEDVLTPVPLAYLRELSDDLGERPWAARSASITNLPLPRRQGPAHPASDPISQAGLMRDLATGALRVDPVLGNGPVTEESAEALAKALADAPLLRGQLYSKDRSVAVLAVLLRDDFASASELEGVIEDVEAYLARHPPPTGVRVDLGGLPYMRVDLVRSVARDQTVLFPAAIVVILLLLLATFRWAPAVILPLVTVGLSAAMLVGLMRVAGEPLNIINNIIPVLIIIVGISDSIHLVNRYGEELASAPDRRAAAQATLRSLIAALFLTSFTTAVGFGSLAVSELPLLARFGVTAAIGVLIAYVVTVVFLPATLSLAPAPRRPIAGVGRGRIERWITLTTAWVLRHRWAVLGGAAAVAAGAAVLARGVDVDTAVRHQYDRDSPAYRAIELLETKLGGVRPVEISLVAEPGRFYAPEVVNAVDRVTRWARKRNGVIAAQSYADLLHESWYFASGDPAARELPFDSEARVRDLGAMISQAASPLGRYVTDRWDRARISVQLADIGGRATVAFVGDLRHELAAELPDDISYAMTGEGYVASHGLNTLTRELMSSLFLALVVIFGFLILVLRSVRLGLLSVPPNLLPLLLTLAYLPVRGIPLSPSTAIIFAISIGLAVDGTIHVLARFREELASGASRDQALRAAAGGTGKAVVVSYVSIIVGFTAFQVSSFVPVRQFGELISVTIAGCLLSTLVVLPALIGIAGPRTSVEVRGKTE